MGVILIYKYDVDWTEYVNYLILSMQSDKISLINYLRSIQDTHQINFQQFLVIIHQNAITLNQTRRFLLQNSPIKHHWKTFTNQEIINISEESYRFIINNRAQWIQQRRNYQNNLLRFHHFYEKIAAKCENIQNKTKIEILSQLRQLDQKENTFIKEGLLKEWQFRELIVHLQGIVNYQQQTSKIIFSNDYESNQHINTILEKINNRNIHQPLLKSDSVKNAITPAGKKIKTSPGNLIKSKSIGELKQRGESKILLRNNSQRGSILFKGRKNFIQQVREEIKNQQAKKSNYRSVSDNESTIIGSNRLVSVHLPKILKLSDEEISTQGIYKSLKKFANYDYVAQQKKIRDIIGISLGQDEEYMSAYFSKQMMVKQQKQFEQHMNREVRRKKILEGLTKKQHHCKKYNPEEVQPYMRF